MFCLKLFRNRPFPRCKTNNGSLATLKNKISMGGPESLARTGEANIYEETSRELAKEKILNWI